MGGDSSNEAWWEAEQAKKAAEQARREAEQARMELERAHGDAAQARTAAQEAQNQAQQDSSARAEAERKAQEARQREEEAESARQEAERAARSWEEAAANAEQAREAAEEAKHAAEERLRQGIPPDIRPTNEQMQQSRERHGYGTHSLNIGVVGESGVGKSALLNAVRGLWPEDSGAAAVGVDETTAHIQGYVDPRHQMVRRTWRQHPERLWLVVFHEPKPLHLRRPNNPLFRSFHPDRRDASVQRTSVLDPDQAGPHQGRPAHP